MVKPYESWREMVDDLQQLYGEVVGISHAGAQVSNHLLVARIGRIVTKAHREPGNHQENVEIAKQAEPRSKPMHRPDLQRGHPQEEHKTEDQPKKRERIHVVKR